MMNKHNISIFDRDLRRDGSGRDLISLIVEISNMLPVYANGAIIYTLLLELRKVNKYYKIWVRLKFDRDNRHSVIIDAKEIDLDQWVNSAWQDERELREVYNEFIKAINNENNK